MLWIVLCTALVFWIGWRIFRWAIRSVRDGADSALTLFGRRNPDAEANIRDFWATLVLLARIALAIFIVVVFANLIF